MCAECSAANGATFCVDEWTRDQSAGITRVLEHGQLLEKAAISSSLIHGTLNAERASTMSSRGRSGVDPAGGQSYSAAALSLVLHSASPLVPTFRADVRLFEVEGAGGWYGGGADLTPFYLDESDVTAFHVGYRDICEAHQAGSYRRFKQWCDEYFYLPGRGEHRGTGGIFFDDLDAPGAGAFCEAVASHFMPSYLPLLARKGRLAYTEQQRAWQLARRGRYVEFNLLYDRGVRFGLSGGRMEAVMVSAPPAVAWPYRQQVEPGSEEAKLLDVLRRPRDWA